MWDNECGSTDNESSLGLEEESNELSGDLARYWEVEQEGPQITEFIY